MLNTTARSIATERLAELRRLCAAPLPHPSADELAADARHVLDLVLRHHGTLSDQPIGATADRATLERLLREPAPEAGRPLTHVLRRFSDTIARLAFRVDHPRFLAFVPGAPNHVALLGDWLATGTNFFGGVWLEAAGPAQVELIVLDWFRDWLGLPPETSGVLTSGGSEANLTALVVARTRLPLHLRDRACLYVVEQRHWSIDRAAMVLGLRPDQIRPVACDSQYALDVAALRQAIADDQAAGRIPWAVVANAGATNTGQVDPLPRIADLCAAERLWLHVDAAYGWSAVLSADGRRQLAGIERADSLTLDPHKWLAQPFETGCVLVRNGAELTRTFAMQPDYLQDAAPAHDEVNFCDHGIALTRRFRALKIWLSIQVLGVGWFRELIDHCLRLTELAEGLLLAAGDFEILSSRHLSILCFRHVPPTLRDEDAALDRHNLQLVEALRNTGRAFLSSTRLAGRVALRLCFVNWRTTTADVEEVIGLLGELGRAAHD